MKAIVTSSLVSLVLFSVAIVGNENDIFDGVRNDDSDAIRNIVADDPSMLESIGPGGQTPLIHATLTGKLEAVKVLLDLGANAFATERDGYNVLHAAGFQGRAEILQVLLDHFERLRNLERSILNPATDRHSDGFYPIHRACWGRSSRHTETVKVFVTNGVPHDLPSKDGMTCEDMTTNAETQAMLSEMKTSYDL